MMAKEIIMGSKKKVIDPLPDSFASEEEAGDFWDTHSLVDYAEHFEPSKDRIKLKDRRFEISVSEEVFNRLRLRARTAHKSLPKVAEQILRKELIVSNS